MVDRRQENFGKYPYITLAQVKDYLSINSTNQDDRIANVLNYATGMVEHYIGQEVLANDYVEVFDGGKTSVMVSRLPLNNVYQVSEFDGQEHKILNDPTTIGTPIESSDNQELTVTFNSGAHLNSRIKRFGKSSLELATADFVSSGTVPNRLKFEEGDFTIEMFIRRNDETITDSNVFSINTDASNFMQFRLANQYGLAFESNISGTPTTAQGANTSVESQQYKKREFAHIAASFDNQEERMRLFYNGNIVANASFAVANNTFTSNVLIGPTFGGYIDELRISDTARYHTDFTPPSKRFRPDDDTVTLVHFDGNNDTTEAKDVHNEVK